LKPVELIVERTAWTPPVSQYTADTLVPLRIKHDDIPMRSQAKAGGGRWNPEKKLWFVENRRRTVIHSGLPVPSEYECDSASAGYPASFLISALCGNMTPDSVPRHLASATERGKRE